MTILQVGAELFHAGQTDRRTDMTKLIVAFRNISNAPKNRLLTDFILKESNTTELSKSIWRYPILTLISQFKLQSREKKQKI